MIVPMVPLMSLTPEQRELLLNGPSGCGKKHDVVKAFGGPCQIITAWRKHRAELMAACPMGKRPYAVLDGRAPANATAGWRARRAQDAARVGPLSRQRRTGPLRATPGRESRSAYATAGRPGLHSEKFADGIADGATLGFAWVRVRNAGNSPITANAALPENPRNTHKAALANRRLQPLGHVSAKAKPISCCPPL